MIKREDVNRIPTTVRDAIVDHLDRCVSMAETRRADSSLAFVETLDEKQRAAALIAQGSIEAFSAVAAIFRQ